MLAYKKKWKKLPVMGDDVEELSDDEDDDESEGHDNDSD
eukprot:CAMPEP_0119333812 /NCGR_PEP_ID=MMETSP1333-20130426/86054_1 /TAXON_ID=418940 /ORGANISM="Scyphosphaera apsteinii, Strain RCC1455" /LENGTH=38 /DNA_ID= /DNA_START= /DNA_END= /DNA_ORIENTATION=